MKMRLLNIRSLLSIFVIAGILIGFISCKENKPKEEKAYQTMVVARTDQQVTNSYSASIRGRQDVEIYPQVQGKITRMCVVEGQRVSRGQLLFVIDQVPFRAAVATVRANVSAANAALATAKLTYESNKELFAQKVISDYTLKTSENAYNTAKAQLAQVKAGLVDARNNFSYTEVKSPSAGVVGTLPYRLGTLVSPQMPQPLTTISDNTEMYVYFSMTENQLLDMSRQYGSLDKAKSLMPEVSLQLNDQSMYTHSGHVATFSGVINPQTGSSEVRAVFPNPERLLHSGASGTVIIPSVYKNCIAVPQAATVQLQNHKIVYKVVKGKAVATMIQVAETDNGRDYIVTDGLQPGDVIISEGAGFVKDGMSVKTKGNKK